MDEDSPLVNFLKVAAGLHAKGDRLAAPGERLPPRATVADPKFMMNYDKNSGGTKMRSDMDQAQRVSDAVPR